MEKELIKEVREARRKAISLSDKRYAKRISNSFGGNQGRDLAIPALFLLLLILIVLSIFTARYIIGDEVIYQVYPQKVEVIKETKIIEKPLIIPEGERETCIQLSNETFRRCFDE